MPKHESLRATLLHQIYYRYKRRTRGRRSPNSNNAPIPAAATNPKATTGSEGRRERRPPSTPPALHGGLCRRRKKISVCRRPASRPTEVGPHERCHEIGRELRSQKMKEANCVGRFTDGRRGARTLRQFDDAARYAPGVVDRWRGRQGPANIVGRMRNSRRIDERRIDIAYVDS